jgi:transposase
MRTSLVGKGGAMAIRYDENTKARAVRLVREHRDDYDSEWAALKAISRRSGMTAGDAAQVGTSGRGRRR